MDLDRFVRQRRGAWTRLETLLARAEERGLEAMDGDELRNLGVLYRQASSDLVYTRSALQNADLADYLNQLVASAYGVIYRKSRFSWKQMKEFFLSGFPARVRRHAGAMIAAAAITVAGILLGGGAVLADADAFSAIVPGQYHELYGKQQEDLRAARFGSPDADQQAAFSGHLYTNNIRVSLLAFALGISFGLLTAVLLFYNGALLGAIAGNALKWGGSLEFWALIVPHGTIELTCVVLAGGAGLVIGRALIAPGRRTRSEAAAAAAKEAVPIALGSAPFLVLAGFLEAFVTPSAMPGPWMKIAIGALAGAAFWAYLLVPRRTAHA